MLETGGSSNMVKYGEFSLLFKGLLSYLSVFSWISNITFLLNLPIQVNGRSTAALIRESLMFQARGNFTLLSMVN